MTTIPIGQINSDSEKVAALNDGKGSKIIASNQCGDFPFRLMKSMDPRCDLDAIADYNKDVIAYVGARNWNKHKIKNDYTNPSQLKFSNIRIPGERFLLDMKWWIDYKVTITFKDFPYIVSSSKANQLDYDIAEGDVKAKHPFLGEDNLFCLRPYPLHQCTDNIHLRINNRDMTTYPMQMLNQRLEYWRQDRLMESCGFCPHRKPHCQTTYEKSQGRSPFMNIGSTYDGDFGNEVVMGDVIFKDDKEGNVKVTSEAITWKAPTGQEGKEEDKSGKTPWVLCNGTITFIMREPVMVEPLDYYSSKNGSKTMNNITNVDLEYNFNNLRNMIQFNCGKLFELSSKKALVHEYKGIPTGSTDWWNAYIETYLDSILDVKIEEAELVIDIATPDLESKAPFVTDYVEYKRYETILSTVPDVGQCRTDKNKIFEIKSDIYPLTYMPNSIYLWVAPNSATRYGSGMRCTLSDTYAQITGVEIDYGNLSKLCHHYDEKDLFLMALRNGLEDRTYADWTRTNKIFYHPLPDYNTSSSSTAYLSQMSENEFYGVGSVLRMIPGIDICSGGERTLIGGMKVTNETIRFTVKFRPLNMTQNLKYSLYVAFEFNGICTITPGYCDLAMIHIDSYNQLANAEKAPRYKISRIYGKGLWDKTKSFFNKTNEFMKRTRLPSTVLKALPFNTTRAIGNVIEKAGYGYGGSRATRMRGGMVIPPGSFYRTY